MAGKTPTEVHTRKVCADVHSDWIMTYGRARLCWRLEKVWDIFIFIRATIGCSCSGQRSQRSRAFSKLVCLTWPRLGKRPQYMDALIYLSLPHGSSFYFNCCARPCYFVQILEESGVLESAFFYDQFGILIESFLDAEVIFCCDWSCRRVVSFFAKYDSCFFSYRCFFHFTTNTKYITWIFCRVIFLMYRICCWNICEGLSWYLNYRHQWWVMAFSYLY